MTHPAVMRIRVIEQFARDVANVRSLLSALESIEVCLLAQMQEFANTGSPDPEKTEFIHSVAAHSAAQARKFAYSVRIKANYQEKMRQRRHA